MRDRSLPCLSLESTWGSDPQSARLAREPVSCPLQTGRCSGQEIVDDIAVDVGQAEIASLEAVRQPFVIDAQVLSSDKHGRERSLMMGQRRSVAVGPIGRTTHFVSV